MAVQVVRGGGWCGVARTRLLELTGPSAVIGTYMGARRCGRLMVSDRAEDRKNTVRRGRFEGGGGCRRSTRTFLHSGDLVLLLLRSGRLITLGKQFARWQSIRTPSYATQTQRYDAEQPDRSTRRSIVFPSFRLRRKMNKYSHWSHYWARPQRRLLYTKYTVRIRITVLFRFLRGVVHFTRDGITGWCGDTENDTTPKGGDF